MLSLFPSLLAYEGFAPAILRLALALVYIVWAYRDFKSSYKNHIAVSALYSLIAVSLVFGIFMQAGALLSLIVLGYLLAKKIQTKAFLTDGINYYLILFLISLSLLFTGPGFIAFDAPL